MITTFMLCDKCRIVLNALSNARSLLLIRQYRHITHTLSLFVSLAVFSLVHFFPLSFFCHRGRRRRHGMHVFYLSLSLSLGRSITTPCLSFCLCKCHYTYLAVFFCFFFLNSIKLQIFHENILQFM